MSSCQMFLTCVHVALPSQTLAGTCPWWRLCSSMYGIKCSNLGITEWEVIHSQLEVNWNSVTIVVKWHLFQKFANHNKTMALVFIVLYRNLQPRHMYISPMYSLRTRSARFVLSFKLHFTDMRCTMRFWHSLQLGSSPPDHMCSNMSSASAFQSLEQDCSAMMGLHPITSVKMALVPNSLCKTLTVLIENTSNPRCHKYPIENQAEDNCAMPPLCAWNPAPRIEVHSKQYSINANFEHLSSQPNRDIQGCPEELPKTLDDPSPVQDEPRWTKKTVGAATNPQARTTAGLFHDDPVHPGQMFVSKVVPPQMDQIRLTKMTQVTGHVSQVWEKDMCLKFQVKDRLDWQD